MGEICGPSEEQRAVFAVGQTHGSEVWILMYPRDFSVRSAPIQCQIIGPICTHRLQHRKHGSFSACLCSGANTWNLPWILMDPHEFYMASDLNHRYHLYPQMDSALGMILHKRMWIHEDLCLGSMFLYHCKDMP